jgi:hypothetical protein
VNGRSACFRFPRNLFRQPRLADARFAAEQKDASAVTKRAVEPGS